MVEAPPGAGLGAGDHPDGDGGGKLVPQPFQTFTQPLRLANPVGFTGPKTYIACVDAPPAGWRDVMVERARTEPTWRYWELATGHGAMVTAPQEVGDLLLETTAPLR